MNQINLSPTMCSLSSLKIIELNIRIELNVRIELNIRIELNEISIELNEYTH